MSTENNDTMLATMAGFGDPDSAIKAEVQQFAQIPYVIFAQPKSTDSWNRILAQFPKAREGDPFLLMPQPQPIVELNPFRYYLLAAQQYWAKENTIGKVLWTCFDADAVTSELRQYIDTCIMVELPTEEFIIARCAFKQTKVPAVSQALRTLKIAKEPEWLDMSPEHAQTSQIPDPRFRFISDVRMVDKISAEDRPYVTAEVTIEPTSLKQFRAILEFISAQETIEAMDAIKESYERRINSMKRMSK